MTPTMTSVSVLKFSRLVRSGVFWLAAPTIIGVACAAPAASSANSVHQFDPKISASDIATDVQVLSSDAFGGRAPSTRGEWRTIDLLSAMLKESGLQPGNGDSWFQTVPVFVDSLTIADSHLDFMLPSGARSLRFGSEVVYSNTTADPIVAIKDSPVVFAGYGINAPDRGWADYAGLNVKGKTVVVLSGLPGDFKPQGVSYYSRYSYKFEEAARRGAAVLLIVHDARASGLEWDYIRSRYTHAQFHLRHQDDPEPEPSVVGWITAATAKSLLASAGLTLRDLRSAADRRGFHALAMTGVALNASIHGSIVAGETHNVIAKLTGTKYPGEAIVYSAHWDHFGTHPDMRGDNIFHGALDNAIGVAAVLEIAAQFAAENPTPDRTVLFLFPTLEEQGLLGSKYYTMHPVLANAGTVVDINFDVMVPTGLSRNFVVVGLNKTDIARWLKPIVARHGRALEREEVTDTDGFFRSDHLSFARAGMPTVYVRGGTQSRSPTVDARAAWVAFGKRYHTPADTYDPNWDLRGVVQDLQIAYEVGATLANSRDWPQWDASTAFKAIRAGSHGSNPSQRQ